jgi:hypothetical protein
MERETGFEPATSYLEGRHSATELLPLIGWLYYPSYSSFYNSACFNSTKYTEVLFLFEFNRSANQRTRSGKTPEKLKSTAKYYFGLYLQEKQQSVLLKIIPGYKNAGNIPGYNERVNRHKNRCCYQCQPLISAVDIPQDYGAEYRPNDLNPHKIPGKKTGQHEGVRFAAKTGADNKLGQHPVNNYQGYEQ